ncbi:MAG: DUF1799 domain-containing protein [Pseudomonadota bacterium]
MDDIAGDLALLGADEEAIEAWRAALAEEDGEDFAVWPENWPTVEVFLALSTQWRWTVAMSQAGAVPIPSGIDYTAIEPTLRLMGREPSPAMFADLRAMEAAALEVLTKA